MSTLSEWLAEHSLAQPYQQPRWRRTSDCGSFWNCYALWRWPKVAGAPDFKRVSGIFLFRCHGDRQLFPSIEL